MTPRCKLAILALALVAQGAVGGAATALSLSAAQRQAAGITIGRAIPIDLPARTAAFGLALDPRPAQADYNAWRAAAPARGGAAAGEARGRELDAGGAGGSGK